MGANTTRQIMTIRTLGVGAAMSLCVLALSACGNTVEERAASGALIGAATAEERRCVRRDRDGDCVDWEPD
jgi:hypothetical protein